MRHEVRERTLHAGRIPKGQGGIGRGMGDYVLDSNPALERLIERLGAQGKPPLPEERSSSNGYATLFRRRKRSKVHPVDDPGIRGGSSSPAGLNDPVEGARVATPAATAQEVALHENLRAIHEDTQADDELVLVDFDEAAEVFAEDPGGQRADESDAYEADDLLEVYEREELDNSDETLYDDEMPVEVLGVENDRRDWILDAFKTWMLESAEAH